MGVLMNKQQSFIFIFGLFFIGQEQVVSASSAVMSPGIINTINFIEVSDIPLIPVSKSFITSHSEQAHLLEHQGNYQILFDFVRPVFCKKEVNGSVFELSFPGMKLKEFTQQNFVKELYRIKEIKKVELFHRSRPGNAVVLKLIFHDQRALLKITQLKEPNRLLIDIFSKEKLEQLSRIDSQLWKAMRGQIIAGKPVRIVLDPGHGGHDQGAINGNYTEKKLTLDIVRRIEKQLKDKNYQLFLTRKSDKFVSLLEREEFTKQCEADLYVSIHINAAAQGSKASGLETYILDEKKFLLPQALIGYFLVLTEQDQALIKFTENCLINKIEQSKKMAEVVHSTLVSDLQSKYDGINDRGIRGGALCGLIRSSAPTILIEVGFISNSLEFSRLQKEQYRQQIAQGVVQGIEKYIATFKVIEK
jgi:N-acetylmuramoyl-L-alanine amidase